MPPSNKRMRATIIRCQYRRMLRLEKSKQKQEQKQISESKDDTGRPSDQDLFEILKRSRHLFTSWSNWVILIRFFRTYRLKQLAIDFSKDQLTASERNIRMIDHIWVRDDGMVHWSCLRDRFNLVI